MRALLLAGVVAFGIAGTAHADTYKVDFSGTYGASAPTTLVSAPNATYDVSFYLPSPFPYFVPGGTDELTTAEFNVNVALGGQPSSDRIQYISFSRSSNNVIILFQDDQATLVFNGTPFYDSGMLTAYSGSDSVYVKPNGQPTVYGGSGTVSATAVPEPASLALLGMGMVGAAVSRRRKEG